MQLYHVGRERIEAPNLRAGRTNADFGPGFYLSPDAEFSKRWAKPRRDATAVLNAYQLRTEGLRIKRLTRDEEWYRAIVQNRAGAEDLLKGCDVVIGPIANDTLYDTWGILTGGLLEPALALELLQLGPCYEQVVIKTEKALRQLDFVSSVELTDELLAPYKGIVSREEDAYQTAFAQRLAQEPGFEE